MKTIQVVLVSAALWGVMFAQSPASKTTLRVAGVAVPSVTQLANANSVVIFNAMDVLHWKLAIPSPDKQYHPCSEKELTVNLGEVLSRKASGREAAEQYFARKHESLLRGLFVDSRVIDAGKFSGFACDLGVSIPVRFANHNGELMLFVQGLETDTVFNTIRTTERGRAASIASDSLIPTLTFLLDHLTKNKVAVKWIGVGGIYGARDFINASDATPEALTMIVATSDLRKFAKNQVAEDDLFANAEFYVSSDSLNPKRIRLVPEH